MGPNTTDFIFNSLVHSVHIPLRLRAGYGLWAGVDEYTHAFHSLRPYSRLTLFATFLMLFFSFLVCPQ